MHRSRLEARWAAFFDAIGWKNEYEPTVEYADKWIPDFILGGDSRKLPVLVEIKPILEWDRAAARKMFDAVQPAAYESGLRVPSTLLLVGSAPILRDHHTAKPFYQIGWVADANTPYEAEWVEAAVGSLSSGLLDIIPGCPDEEPTSLGIGPFPILSRHAGPIRLRDDVATYSADVVQTVAAAWVSAANATQWFPRRKKVDRE